MPTPKRARRKVNLTLAPDVIEALKARSRDTDVPQTRIVDAALRAVLGLPDPRKQAPAAS